VDEDCLF
jgi:hypothetical protein